mmetsp:Transcript_76434/g.165405  ORF Transcript_76434/g.165405 Transcript_76434/m.165405 type:complete len:315 (+) Transcript_76434:339-1283(+)
MTSIIKPKEIGIYHTNFPVSAKALTNFKNPLAKVGFTVKNQAVPLGSILPDSFPGESKDEPRNIGWQQPIISWTSQKASGLKPGDLFVNAETAGTYKPFTEFSTARITKRGRDYVLNDSFMKKKYPALFGSNKAKDGAQSNIRLPNGDNKFYAKPSMPNNLIRLNKSMKIKRKSNKSSVKKIVKKFKLAKKKAKKAKKALKKAKMLKKELEDDKNFNENLDEEDSSLNENNSNVESSLANEQVNNNTNIPQMQSQINDILNKLKGIDQSSESVNKKAFKMQLNSMMQQLKTAEQKLDKNSDENSLFNLDNAQTS